MEVVDRIKQDIEEANKKLAVIDELKAIITVPINSLFYVTKDVTIELNEMGLQEGIKYLSSLSLLKTAVYTGFGLEPIEKMTDRPKSAGTPVKKNFGLKVCVYSNTNQRKTLFGFIKTPSGTLVEVKIPINDILEPIAQHKHNGSTSRSKIVGKTILHTPKPFNWYINWAGTYDIEFFVTK